MNESVRKLAQSANAVLMVRFRGGVRRGVDLHAYFEKKKKSYIFVQITFNLQLN